jgi:putative protein-disulfide isomerase
MVKQIIYGYDPLCGWCYGFIPALQALKRDRPDIEVQLKMGGLVTGERIRPYKEIADYIKGASTRMASVTGQHLGQAFFERILLRDDILISSYVPCAAVLQMRQTHPTRVLDFAHGIQIAHFRDGEDLNALATYENITKSLGIAIEFELPAAHELPTTLAEEFSYTRSLGINSFPTILVKTDDKWQALPTLYKPKEFLRQLGEI